MNLLLEIISHQRYMMTEEQSQFIFKAAGGTIGRNQNNDWLIDDPERLISGQHALIYFENHQFFILDISTNGLFVNKNQQALGDQRHTIINGDIFLLGQYSFQATLIATQSNAVFSTSRSHSLSHDERLPQNSALIPPNSIAANENSASLLSHDLQNNLNQHVDPLSFFNDSSTSGSLAEQNIPAESLSVNSVLDPIPATQSYFDLPDAIPENWLHNQSIEQKTQTVIIPEKNGQDGIVGSFEDFKKDFNVKSINQDFIEEKFNEDKVSLTTSKIESISEELPESEPLNKPNKEKVSAAPVSVPDKSLETGQSNSVHPDSVHPDAINVLLETLGINPVDISSEQLPELTKNIALIARSSMNGMMKSMISRAHLKNEFRLSMTTIQSENNNPLKFCINYDQLVHYMLLNPISGYLDAEQAVQESFTELQEHQVGVVAGMKSALKYMLDILSPEKVVEKVEQSKLKTLGLGSKKSRYWDAYNDLYNDIEDEDEVFDTLFGNEFCKAYERQIESIRQARK